MASLVKFNDSKAFMKHFSQLLQGQYAYYCLYIIYPQIQQQYMHSKSTFSDQNMDRSIPQLSKSFVYTLGDSMKSISDCTTVLSEVDFMEESYQTQGRQDLETSFKKQLMNSQNLNSSCNPNAKKNTFLVVETPRKQVKKTERKSVHYENELTELENIEKKTQDLVMKEKQQRRELKKMKKLYIEKVEELKRCQDINEINTASFQDQIAKLVRQKDEALKEKLKLEKAMRQLSDDVQRTKSEIMNYQQERQHLLHRIELLQINFEPKVDEKIQSPIVKRDRKTEDLDKQLEIINKMIKETKENADPKEVNRLLQVKVSLLEQRQKLSLKEQRLRQEKTIIKLNEVILSRNNLLRSRNKHILELKGQLKEQPVSNSKDQEKFVETSDTFFQGTKNEEIEEQDETAQWDEFKDQVRKVVQTNSIVGYQESYEAIQTIVLGMIHLFENETCCEQDVILLIQTCLDNLSSKYADKARNQVMKIEQMLTFFTKNERKSKLKASKDQQNYPTSANILRNKLNT